MTDRHVETAITYFNAVYGGKTSDLGEVASSDVVSTYPMFQRMFSQPAIRGREALTEFATRFSTTWTSQQITIEETVAQGDTVVLMWSFTARNTGPRPDGEPPTNKEASWGGITLFRFDGTGKIVAEIGEESFPGPGARLRDSADG